MASIELHASSFIDPHASPGNKSRTPDDRRNFVVGGLKLGPFPSFKQLPYFIPGGASLDRYGRGLVVPHVSGGPPSVNFHDARHNLRYGGLCWRRGREYWKTGSALSLLISNRIFPSSRDLRSWSGFSEHLVGLLGW